jgi:hypothetical protein
MRSSLTRSATASSTCACCGVRPPHRAPQGPML